MSLTEKVKKLIEVESIRLEIDEFCRQEYNKQFKQNTNPSPYSGWYSYKGFDIMSTKQLRVNYAYGSGDYEFSGNFVVDLIEFDRDSKIGEII